MITSNKDEDLKKNHVYNCNCLELMALIPEKSVNLIIADPPYFEVKGDFDFIWSSFEDYLKDVEKWTIACKRVLADNGTLFWYGHAKKIAYSQVILDKYFNLENNITIEFNRQTKKGVELFRCFAPITERCLMYSNEIIRTGLEEIKLDINNFQSLRRYFKDFQEDLGLGLKATNELLGHRKAEHCFYWNSTQWDMPTPETYADLLKLPSKTGFLRREYEDLRREYEDLRREYEDLRRPFNNFLKLFDVMKFDQEAHITRNYEHETQKPETLSRALILTCSHPTDIVLIPFAGSGTECAMSAREKRDFYACDISEKHCKTANERVSKELSQPTLF